MASTATIYRFVRTAGASVAPLLTPLSGWCVTASQANSCSKRFSLPSHSGLCAVGQDIGQRQAYGIRAIDYGEMAVGRQRLQRRPGMAELVAEKLGLLGEPRRTGRRRSSPARRAPPGPSARRTPPACRASCSRPARSRRRPGNRAQCIFRSSAIFAASKFTASGWPLKGHSNLSHGIQNSWIVTRTCGLCSKARAANFSIPSSGWCIGERVNTSTLPGGGPSWPGSCRPARPSAE